MGQERSLVKKYLILCFSITYITWGAIAAYSQIYNVNFNEYSWMYALYIIGVLGPAISVIWIGIKSEKYTLKRILTYICQPPRHKRDWIFCVIISIAFSVIPFVIFGGEKLGSFINLLIYLPTFFVIGGLEEIGWRGFWLEQVIKEKKRATFKTIFTMGIVWQLWHLPLFFMLGTYQQKYVNIGIHTLWTIALSFALGALYICSRSTILCIFSHCIINAIGNILVVRISWYEATIKLVTCIIIFFLMTYEADRKGNSK